MIDLITISRQYGSGGGEVARRIGTALNWPVYDEQLGILVAKKLRVGTADVVEMDEVPPSLFERVVSILLLVKPPELLHPVDTEGLVSADRIAECTREVLTEVSETPPAVVVGHGAQCLFQKRRRTLHLRLVAPLQVRVDRLLTKAEVAKTRQEMLAITERMDHARGEYIRRHYGVDWQDGSLYALQINTGRVTLEEATRIVVGLVREEWQPSM